MMTSTFSTSRSADSIRDGIKEIQTKKEALEHLEQALKLRLNELKELCLKEGEITGHLPVDYPLQPREPIPQVRRKNIQNVKNLILGTNSIDKPCLPPSRPARYMKQGYFLQPQQVAFLNNRIYHPQQQIPSRPTSTNSSSSSLSTASSNARSSQNSNSIINNNINNINNNNNIHHLFPPIECTRSRKIK